MFRFFVIVRGRNDSMVNEKIEIMNFTGFLHIKAIQVSSKSLCYIEINQLLETLEAFSSKKSGYNKEIG